MAYIEPKGKVWLCKNVPLNPSYEDTMTWNSIEEQINYFIGKTKWSSEKYTPIKERQGVLRFNGAVNKFYDCNYMMFENDNFYNTEYNWGEEKYNRLAPKKYFFAFITNVEYVNPETTLIHFQLDVMQSWFFEIEWERSLIEREHVKDDSLYANLEPEDIQVNERIAYSKEFNLSQFFGDRILVTGFTENPNNIEVSSGGSALGNFKVPYSPYTSYPTIQEITIPNVKQVNTIYNISTSNGSALGNASYSVEGKCFWVDASIEEFTFYLKSQVTVDNEQTDLHTYFITATKGEVWVFRGFELEEAITGEKDEVIYNFTQDAPNIGFGLLDGYKIKECGYDDSLSGERYIIDWTPAYVIGKATPRITFYVPKEVTTFSFQLEYYTTWILQNTYVIQASKNSEGVWEYLDIT